MPKHALRCSTVYVSIGRTRAVYRSVAEIPRELRERILDERSGFKTATVVIADRGGREELLRAARGEASPLRLRIPVRPTVSRVPRWLNYARIGIELLTFASAAALLWVIATAR